MGESYRELISKNRRVSSKSFEEVVKGFPEKLAILTDLKRRLNMSEYFGNKIGVQTSIKLLLRDEKIPRSWLKKCTTNKGGTKIDFKGIYLFYQDNLPFYAGISRGVISRLNQHVKGKSHFTSSLAYKIGCMKYKSDNKEEYLGERKDFDFDKFVEPAKKYLLSQQVSFISIEDNDELALFEIYSSMKLGLYLNSFKTH